MRKVIVILVILGLLLTLSSGAIADEPRYSYKNPGTALLLSLIIVGAGQIYNEEVGKGILMMILFYGGSVVMQAGQLSENYGVALAGAGTVVITGLWSWFDAYRSAERINKEHGFTLKYQNSNPYIGYSFSFR